MLVRYVATLNRGRLILWCYFIWYMVVLVRYFDPNPRLWLTSLGLALIQAGVPADTRATYLKAINASLNACMPLKFTDGLGGALAGRPIAIRYVDNRALGKASDKQ